MFCNCSPNVQLNAGSKNIFTCSPNTVFTLSKEVKNSIYLREDAGKFMCVHIWPESAHGV